MAAKKVKAAKKTVKKPSINKSKNKSEKVSKNESKSVISELNSKPAKSQGLTYEQAREYVDSIKDFYKHLASFVVVIGFLTALNLITSPESLWVLWVVFGWGIGLTLHGVSVFMWSSVKAMKWENEMIEKLVDESKGKVKK